MFSFVCFKCSAALNSSQIFMLPGFLVVTAASESENHHHIFSNNAGFHKKTGDALIYFKDSCEALHLILFHIYLRAVL